MRRLITRARALRERGVLGMNQRNARLVLPLNPRRYYPRVDDKLLTKQLADAAAIPTPALLGVVRYYHELADLPALLVGRDTFVLKPARGAQGNGIVVITAADGRTFHKSSGALLNADQLRQHVSNTISGVFSLRGDPDACLLEQRVILHPAFADIAHRGIPDIRVVAYRGLPVMAMCRLPTAASDGRANLHQGAIGAGIAIASGTVTHAAMHHQNLTRHADTGKPIIGTTIPQWDAILSLAVRAADMSGLGYLGVDVVVDATRGPLLLELNARPGLAIQIANNEGLLPRLRRADTLPDTAFATCSDRLQAARALY